MRELNKKTMLVTFIILMLLTIFTQTSYAQVTIGAGEPPQEFSILEISAKYTKGGLDLPQLSTHERDSITATPAFKKEMAGKACGLTLFNTDKKEVQYWDGAQWVTAGKNSPWHVSPVSGASSNPADHQTATGYNQDIYRTGHVTIGNHTKKIDPAAILNVVASDKGVLLPRVALISSTDMTTIANPTTGLLAYNTGTAGLKAEGYVYWNGNEWRKFGNSSLSPGTIGSITCNGVSLTPSIYKAGIPYEGTMIIPYTGGNGGMYPEQTTSKVNGLTATLVSGNFEVGAGNLAYTVKGIPTKTTPETTTFTVNVGGKTCHAVIGTGDGIAPGDLVYYATDEFDAAVSGVDLGTFNYAGDPNNGYYATGWLSSYIKNLPIIGGKLRLDGYFNKSSSKGKGTVSFNPRLVNITDKNVKFWFSAMTTVNNYNASNIVLAPGKWVNLDDGIYLNLGMNSTVTSPTNPNTHNKYGVTVSGDQSEVVTLDLSLDSKWYRVYYYPIIDNKDGSTTPKRKIYMSIQRLY
ncbi:MAG: hypothetical protein LBV71_03615 [Prevotella sp.]|jgi:hypothetical protein|nr:hypothetical protein [Prevotella sp.]